MFELVTYKPEHVAQIAEQEAQAYLRPYLEAGFAQALGRSPYKYTAVLEGKPIGCAGLYEVWSHRAEAWAILDQGFGVHLFQATKVIKRVLEIVPYRRIEAFVDSSFEQGHRWIRLLGFKLECARLERYRPDGGDCALYVRLKPGEA